MRKVMLVLLGVMMSTVAVAQADEAINQNSWLAMADKSAETKPAAATAPVDAAPVHNGWEKPIPVTFSVDYTLVSEYVWRGQDLSPSSRMNHQLTVGTEVSLGEFGNVGGNVWFQWNTGNEPHVTQEIDYTVYYNYTIEPIALTAEIGFIYYAFPGASAGNTSEIYCSLSWDDSMLWNALGLQVEGGLLNPSLALYFDIDEGNGVYGEIGIGKDFAFADWGCGGVPVVKDMSLSVSGAFGFGMCDYAWTNGKDGMLTATAGMALSLDLKSMMNIPDQYCGGLYVTGFLNLTNALVSDEEAAGLIDCDVWGGLSVGYEW